MISGEKWMLIRRSLRSASFIADRSITAVRILVVAVGRLRQPFADDNQHYHKLLARHARVEVVEVREGEHVLRRLPERAFVSLLDRDGEELDSLAFSRFLEQRRQSGQDLCFVIGGP